MSIPSLLSSLLLSLVLLTACGTGPGDDDDDDDDDAADDDDASGPEGLDVCTTFGTGSIPVTGQAVVGNDSMLFDIYEIDAVAGDCIWVKGDNGPEGADILAFVSDSAGNFYGLAQDFSELDDEWNCTTPHAGGFGCPEAGVIASADGTVQIGIAVWPDDGINSDYTLNIAVNGTDVDPGAPTQDDAAIQ